MIRGIQSKLHRAAHFGIVLFLAHAVCDATTLVDIVTPQGIVCGADSRIITADLGGVGTLEKTPTEQKVFLVGQRFCISAQGLTGIDHTYLRQGWIPARILFKVDEFVSILEKGVKTNTTLAQLVDMVEAETAADFAGFDGLIELNRLDFSIYGLKAIFPDNRVIEFLIGGYDQSNRPVIISLHFDINWRTERLEHSIEVVPVFPPKISGFQRIIRDFWKQNSLGYSRMAPLAPEAMATLTAGNFPSLEPTILLVHMLLKAEADNTPDYVYPPFVLVIVPLHGEGKVITFEK
jgi:hypothetical protein